MKKSTTRNMNKILDMDILELNLPRPVYNRVRWNLGARYGDGGLKTVRELLRYDRREILRTPGFGKKYVQQIIDALAKYDLRLPNYCQHCGKDIHVPNTV